MFRTPLLSLAAVFGLGLSSALAAGLPATSAQATAPSAATTPHAAAAAHVAGPLAMPTFKPLRKHPVVALSFDDLPAAGGLRPGESRVSILTALSHELRAAHMKGVYGYVNAVDLPGDPDCQHALEIWMRAGMRLGSHTWSHPALDDVTASAYEANIAKNEPYVQQYADANGKKTDWHWFRYPYLEEGNTAEKHEDVRRWLRAHGYRVAEVTLNFNDDDWGDAYLRCKEKGDTAGIDWLEKSYLASAAAYIPVERQREQIAFGHEIPNVLLLHGTEFTTLMLPRLITLLRSEGFRFSTVPKVERNRAYRTDPVVGIPGGANFTNEVLAMRGIKVPYPKALSEPHAKLDSICGGESGE
ncbi:MULTISPECIES: polysaccharide deacetylase family protein [Acidobacterium]|nr:MULTISPECIES: polysaccharide deacetylase family protein [Acidobacterium]